MFLVGFFSFELICIGEGQDWAFLLKNLWEFLNRLGTVDGGEPGSGATTKGLIATRIYSFAL